MVFLSSPRAEMLSQDPPHSLVKNSWTAVARDFAHSIAFLSPRLSVRSRRGVSCLSLVDRDTSLFLQVPTSTGETLYLV